MYLTSDVLWIPSASRVGGILPRIHVSTFMSEPRVGPTRSFQKSLPQPRFFAMTLYGVPPAVVHSMMFESPVGVRVERFR